MKNVNIRRWAVQFGIWILLAACHPQNKEVAARLTQASVSPAADDMVLQPVQKSQVAINEYAQALKKHLVAALQEGGPTEAIEVCHSKAPELADAVSAKHKVEVSRVSARFRNPGNQPDAWQKEVLAYLAANPYGADFVYAQTGEGQHRYMQAIRTEGICLSCHGNNLAGEVKQALVETYPLDRATGYQLGELRGAFSVDFPAPAQEGGAELQEKPIKAFAQIKPGLYTGGQPSAAQLIRLSELGVTTVINLRPREEMEIDELSIVEGAGMSYINLPISGAEGITWGNAKQLSKLLKSTDGSVFLHCSSSNRVGALLALGAAAQGVAISNALRIGRLAGMTRLEEKTRSVLESLEPTMNKLEQNREY